MIQPLTIVLDYVVELIDLVASCKDLDHCAEVNTKIQDVTRASYKLFRKKPEVADELYDVLDKLLTHLKTFDTSLDDYYNRLLSLTCCKHDIALQHQITKERVDNYLEDVRYFIFKEAYKTNVETPLKILESLAKVQFAYNILDNGDSVEELYKTVHRSIMADGLYLKLMDHCNTTEDNFDHEMGITFFYPFLFVKKENRTSNYQYIMLHILYRWKIFKMRFYSLTMDQIIAEGYEKYDFI